MSCAKDSLPSQLAPARPRRTYLGETFHCLAPCRTLHMDGGAVIARTSCRQIRIGHSLRADNIHIRLAICHSTPYILRFNTALSIRITIDDEGGNGGVHYTQRDGLENGV